MKTTRKLWILLTIVLLFTMFAAPIQASSGGDEPARPVAAITGRTP